MNYQKTHTYGGADFYCEATAQGIEVWGPCHILMRVRKDGSLYCNINEVVDGAPFPMYTALLGMLADTAVEARFKENLRYTSTELLAHQFITTLHLRYGVDLARYAGRSEEETYKMLGRQAMELAREALGRTAEGELADAAWAEAQRRLTLLYP